MSEYGLQIEPAGELAILGTKKMEGNGHAVCVRQGENRKSAGSAVWRGWVAVAQVVY